MDYSRLPKIELHLHLDCSLSYEVVQQLDPNITREFYLENFIAPGKCPDLAAYISRSGVACALMQDRPSLRLVTLDLFRQLAEDHIIYAELRFAPLLHTENGLSAHEVVDEVNKSVEQGIKEYGVHAGIICCTLRNYNEKQSMETVKLVEDFKGSHVVGFDIAADEAGFPIDQHIKAFEYAKEKGILCTAHAGEARGPKSVWETLQHFKPSRIGHGVRSVEDEELLDFLRKEDIHLEICPTSNVQTNVIKSIEDHPVDKIYKSGVSLSVNTDAKTITNVTLTHEYKELERLFGWKKAHFLKCNLEAIRHAFAPDWLKKELTSQILSAWT